MNQMTTCTYFCIIHQVIHYSLALHAGLRQQPVSVAPHEVKRAAFGGQLRARAPDKVRCGRVTERYNSYTVRPCNRGGWRVELMPRCMLSAASVRVTYRLHVTATADEHAANPVLSLSWGAVWESMSPVRPQLGLAQFSVTGASKSSARGRSCQRRRV